MLERLGEFGPSGDPRLGVEGREASEDGFDLLGIDAAAEFFEAHVPANGIGGIGEGIHAGSLSFRLGFVSWRGGAGGMSGRIARIARKGFGDGACEGKSSSHGGGFEEFSARGLLRFRHGMTPLWFRLQAIQDY